MSVDCRAVGPRRTNVLLLDGGGVRGFSSLIILQELMRQINQSIEDKVSARDIHVEIKPHDVFDLVAGTGTGGLIAIMLGKIGMSVDECIAQYYKMSKSIFGKNHFRGRLTYGLAPTRSSGKRLQKYVKELLQDKNLQEDHPMLDGEGKDKIACAVVCREHTQPSQYSSSKGQPMCICSTDCPDPIAANVCDAARAVSAAPPFFPVVDIQGRSFVSGGTKYNNPSFAILYHYCQEDRINCGRIHSGPPAFYNKLNFSNVRYVNLGTGTKTDEVPQRKRNTFAKFVPGPIHMAISLKQTLTEIAVESENQADFMRILQRLSSGRIKYERFSAGNGVCWIKLDRYLGLEKIERLTHAYLSLNETQESLRQVAGEIAAEYMERHRADIAPTEHAMDHTEPPQVTSWSDDFNQTDSGVSGIDAAIPQSTPPKSAEDTTVAQIGTAKAHMSNEQVDLNELSQQRKAPEIVAY